jgi:hypothetical protein
MHEIVGDLFDSEKADAICITTNGFVNSQGSCTMGAGNALQAKQRWPGIQMRLGALILKKENLVHLLTVGEAGELRIPLFGFAGLQHHRVPYHIVSFPTKHHWKDNSDLKLIEQSARQLVELAATMNWHTGIVLPRPGCGLGKLSWKGEVRPLLEPILDDRFYVISPK